LEGATVKSDGTVELDIAKQTRAVILNIKKILSCAGDYLSLSISIAVGLVRVCHALFAGQEPTCLTWLS